LRTPAIPRTKTLYASPEPHDDAGRLFAGAELLQPAGIVAPSIRNAGFLTPEYYQRIARALEEGKIQMAFFDDRLALPDLYTGHHAEAVAAGVRAVFANEGAKLAIAEIDARSGEETAHLAGNEAIAIRADVTDPDSLQAAIRATVNKFGRLDVLHKMPAALPHRMTRQSTRRSGCRRLWSSFAALMLIRDRRVFGSCLSLAKKRHTRARHAGFRLSEPPIYR
jgi:hypothetical protein